LETIEREIEEIESTKDTTYRTCERLAWLYIVRDHLRPTQTPSGHRTQTISGSEFLELSSGVSYPALMGILDEHMSALAVVNKKQYEAIIDKMRMLRQ
jgi:hypothetical protein